jgi:hypothetical protein
MTYRHIRHLEIDGRFLPRKSCLFRLGRIFSGLQWGEQLRFLQLHLDQPAQQPKIVARELMAKLKFGNLREHSSEAGFQYLALPPRMPWREMDWPECYHPNGNLVCVWLDWNSDYDEKESTEISSVVSEFGLRSAG